MKEEKYKTQNLKIALQHKKIATINTLAKALGTDVRMTVLRKLGELDYQTSYSHKGKFYTLKQLCQFDESGLWSCRDVWFSLYGTLLKTGCEFINRAESGYSVTELDSVLHVSTKQALLHLYNKSRVYRDKFDGVFIYFSMNKRIREKQILARKKISIAHFNNLDSEVLAHELKAAIVLFYSILDERQRRIFAGLESLLAGHGGDVKVAELLGIDPHTVSKGRAELLARDVALNDIRKKGAGRQSVKKNTGNSG